MTYRYLEDFATGDTWSYGNHLMTTEEILEFARKYDPERFHVDPAAAKQTIFGGLIASGLHVAALLRKMNQARFPDLKGQGSPGWDEVRWLKPVYPGDRLSVHSEVIETRPSKSRPTLGLIKTRHEVRKADGTPAMSAIATILVDRRPDAATE